MLNLTTKRRSSMNSTSIKTELDEILNTIDNNEDAEFQISIMNELGLRHTEYSKKESELIRKSQRNIDLNEVEKEEIEAIIKKNMDEEALLNDMVKAYLAQGNRLTKPAILSLH